MPPVKERTKLESGHTVGRCSATPNHGVALFTRWGMRQKQVEELIIL